MSGPRLEAHEISAPAKTRAGEFRLDTIDRLWGFFCIAVAYSIGTMYGWFPVGLIASLILLLTLHRFENGRVYRQVLDALINLKNQVVNHHETWNAESGDPPPVPIRNVVEFIDPDGKSVGLIDLNLDGTYGSVVFGDGSNITRRDAVSARKMLKELAQRLVRNGPNVGTSFVNRTRPADPWPLADFYGEGGLSPYVFTPNPLDDPNVDDAEKRRRKRHHNLHALVEAGQAMDRATARKPTMATVVIVRGNGKLAKSTKVKAGETAAIDAHDLAISPTVKTATQRVRDLTQSGVRNAHIGTAAEVREFVRSTWDSVGMPEFYDQQHAGQVDSADTRLHLPRRRMREYRDHLEIDDNIIAQFRVTGMPTIIDPFFFLASFCVLDLEGHPINSTTAMVGNSVDASTEAQALSRSIAILRSITSLYSGNNYQSSRSIERDASLEERERSIGRSGYRLTDFSIIIAVWAPKNAPHKLEENAMMVNDHLEGLGLEFRRIKGGIQQRRSMWSTSGFSF